VLYAHFEERDSVSDRSFAILAFKLVGLWFGTYGLIRTADASWFFVRGVPADLDVIVFTFLPGFVASGLGICVWLGAEGLASRAFGPGDAREVQSLARPDGFLTIALVATGSFVIVEAIPDLAKAVALLVLGLHGPASIMGGGATDAQRALLWSASAKANAVAAIVRLLLGLALVLGPARLTAALVRIRRELRGSFEEAAANEPMDPPHRQGGV